MNIQDELLKNLLFFYLCGANTPDFIYMIIGVTHNGSVSFEITSVVPEVFNQADFKLGLVPGTITKLTSVQM